MARKSKSMPPLGSISSPEEFLKWQGEIKNAYHTIINDALKEEIQNGADFKQLEEYFIQEESFRIVSETLDKGFKALKTSEIHGTGDAGNHLEEAAFMTDSIMINGPGSENPRARWESVPDRIIDVGGELIPAELKTGEGSKIKTLDMSVKSKSINMKYINPSFAATPEELEKKLHDYFIGILTNQIQDTTGQLNYLKKKYFERFSSKFMNLIMATTIEREKFHRNRRTKEITMLGIHYMDYTNIVFLKTLSYFSQGKNVAQRIELFSENVLPMLLGMDEKGNLNPNLSSSSTFTIKNRPKAEIVNDITSDKVARISLKLSPIVAMADLKGFYDNIAEYTTIKNVPPNPAAYPHGASAGDQITNFVHAWQFRNAIRKGYTKFRKQ